MSSTMTLDVLTKLVGKAGSSEKDRNIRSFGLRGFWVPNAHAARVLGVSTGVPVEHLGDPLPPAYAKDGSLKRTSSGLVQRKPRKSILDFANRCMEAYAQDWAEVRTTAEAEHPQELHASYVEAAEKALPLIEKASQDIAVDEARIAAAQAAQAEEAITQPARMRAAA